MTWKEAAIKILQETGDPMRPEVMLEEILSKKLKTTKGKTPLLTLRTEIYRSCVERENIGKHTSNNIFYELENGYYGLYAWVEAENYFDQNYIRSNNSREPNEIEIKNSSTPIIDIIFPSEEDDQVFPEGKEVYVLHIIKERNQNLISSVKNERYRINSELPCEVCGLSFIKTYGIHGDKFIEAHHTKPLSELTEETIANPNEIALVCSNCHKMIHRFRPWLSLESLKEILIIKIT